MDPAAIMWGDRYLVHCERARQTGKEGSNGGGGAPREWGGGGDGLDRGDGEGEGRPREKGRLGC